MTTTDPGEDRSDSAGGTGADAIGSAWPKSGATPPDAGAAGADTPPADPPSSAPSSAPPSADPPAPDPATPNPATPAPRPGSAPPPDEAIRPPSGLVSELATAIWAAAWGDRSAYGPSVLAINTTPGKRLVAQLFSVGAVIGIYAAAWGELDAALHLPSHLALPLALAFSAPLLWLPGRPLVTWRFFTLAFALCTVWHTQAGWWPWPVTSAVFYLLLCLWIAFLHPARTVLGVWLLGSAAITLPAWLALNMSWLAMALICAVIGLVVAVGQALGRWRKAERLVVVQQAELQADQTARAVLAERTRIARELHDVVAHHMSMISIQAQAAPLRDPDLSEQSRQTFELIESTSRQSLTEMRRIIGLLREPQESGARDPQPSLAGVADLVAQAQAAGQQTELIQTGTTRPIPDGVSISVYRIVQEALTNARRHAPGSRTRIELHATDRELRVAVVNGPAAHAADDGASPTAAAELSAAELSAPAPEPEHEPSVAGPSTPEPEPPAPPTEDAR